MANKQKILIVDDDNNIAELISLYLTKECFDTTIVNDGESVFPIIEKEPPELILLDLMLPGMDGYQVCREVRAKHEIPIIMLSAKGEVFDKVLGLELGADDYIEKPFDSKELVARVKAVLRRYKTTAPEIAVPVPAYEEKKGGIPGSCYQSHQLFRDLPRKQYRYAPERTGAFILSRILSEPRIYQRTASGSGLGV